MAAPKATYEITSKDKSKGGIDSAKKNVSGLAKSGIASAGKMIAKWAAALIAVKKLADGIKKSLELYEEQEMSEIRLAAAMRNNPMLNGDAFRSLTDYASALQQTTIFGDEALIQQQAFLATLQLSEQQIKDVLGAATNLASTGMVTLESAVRNLARQYGGMTGELGELMPQLKELNAEQLRAGEGIQLIAEQYDGIAEAVAGGTRGLKQQMQNMWGDFGEGVGEALAPVQRAVMQKLKPVLDSISAWMSEHSRMFTNFILNMPEIAGIAFQAIKDGMRQAFTMEQIIENIKSSFEHTKRLAVILFTFMANTFLRMAETILSIWGQVGRSLWDVIKRVANTLWDPITFAFEWVIHGIRVGWRGMVEGLAKSINWLVNGPINWFGQAFHDVAFGVGEAFEWVLGGITSSINFIIEGLNRVVHTASNIGEHGIRFGRYEEYDPNEGAIGKLNEVSIQWGQGFERVTRDVLPQWEEVLTPPDRNLGAEIGETWEGFGSQFVTQWTETINGLGDTWEGFGQEFLDTVVAVQQSGMKLQSEMMSPYREALQGMMPEINALLMQELPFELRSVVETLVDQLDQSGTEAIRSAFSDGDFFDYRQFMEQTDKTYSAWDLFNIYLKQQGDKVRERLIDFGNSVREAGRDVVDRFKGAGRFIRLAITDPQEALAEAGFALVRTLRNISENSEQVMAAVGEGMSSAAAFAGNALLSLVNMIWGVIQGTEIFQDTIQVLNEAFTKLANDLLKPLLDVIRPVIDIIISLASSIANALAPVFEALAPIVLSLSPIIDGVKDLFAALGNILINLIPLIDMVAQLLVQVLAPVLSMLSGLFDVLGEVIAQIMPVIQTLLNLVMSILNPVLEALASILESIYPLFYLLADILLALTPIINGLAALIEGILTPVLTFLADLISVVLTPVINILAQVMTILAPLFNILGVILKGLTPLFNILGQLLGLLLAPLEILGILLELLNPLFQLLAIAVEMLVPVFDVLMLAVDAVTRPIEFLGDALTWIVDVFKAVGHNIVSFILNLLSFGTANREYVGIPEFQSDAFTRPLGQSGSATGIDLPTTDEITTGVATPVIGDGAGGFGGGAQYGGTNLTVNVYIETEAIVGEPGLREFAVMINNEIEDARNLGIL